MATTIGPISASGNTEDELVNFPGSHYADPLLTWLDPVAVTDLEFLESSKLGESYSNNLFVGDNNNGNIYYFRLNPDRTALALDNVPDLVVDNEEEQSSIIFGSGFGPITDLETGPGDGYLYVLSYDDGIIYRVVPSSEPSSTSTDPLTDEQQQQEEEVEDETADNGENN